MKGRTFQLGPRKYGIDGDSAPVVLSSMRVRSQRRSPIARAGLWLGPVSFAVWDDDYGGQFGIQLWRVNIMCSW